MREKLKGSQPNDPEKFARLVVDVVRGEGLMVKENETGQSGGESELKPWPARLIVGSDAERDVRMKINEVEKGLKEYSEFIHFIDRE